MEFEGVPRKKPLKLGVRTTIDAESGEVLDVKPNAMAMLPPKGDVCQECAVDHPRAQPHNRDSPYYQMAFYSTHGRWPTWTDAMQHCAEPVRAVWRELLVERMRQCGVPVPDDLVN